MQVIVVAVLFAILGVILGLLSPVTIPITYARYTAVALLAALDSIFGAFKAYIAGTFEPRVFFSGRGCCRKGLRGWQQRHGVTESDRRPKDASDSASNVVSELNRRRNG